jgi:uncharacterized protein YndB with AHSA1/START domain
MKTIEQTYQIKVPVQEVWKALTDPKIINKWGGGPAVMSGVTDSEFSLWGGDIHGKNTEVVLNKKLVQEWYSGDWKQPSKVTFNLLPKGDTTKVQLIHEVIPDEEVKDIADGWKTYYLGPMKQWLEKEL